ncbi:MAG: prepilin-type N-terminal cleavage/methylation domain-containing protein [Candidatus Margulisiibacteriota bacterium]
MRRKGFTLIELILSVVVAGMILLSFAASYRQMIAGLIYDSDLSKAIALSQLEFSIINSISYTDPSLSNGYNALTSNYKGSGYDMRRQVSYDLGTDATAQSLKRITITVYRGGSASPILSTVTLRAKNVSYGP